MKIQNAAAQQAAPQTHGVDFGTVLDAARIDNGEITPEQAQAERKGLEDAPRNNAPSGARAPIDKRAHHNKGGQQRDARRDGRRGGQAQHSGGGRYQNRPHFQPRERTMMHAFDGEVLKVSTLVGVYYPYRLLLGATRPGAGGAQDPLWACYKDERGKPVSEPSIRLEHSLVSGSKPFKKFEHDKEGERETWLYAPVPAGGVPYEGYGAMWAALIIVSAGTNTCFFAKDIHDTLTPDIANFQPKEDGSRDILNAHVVDFPRIDGITSGMLERGDLAALSAKHHVQFGMGFSSVCDQFALEEMALQIMSAPLQRDGLAMRDSVMQALRFQAALGGVRAEDPSVTAGQFVMDGLHGSVVINAKAAGFAAAFDGDFKMVWTPCPPALAWEMRGVCDEHQLRQIPALRQSLNTYLDEQRVAALEKAEADRKAAEKRRDELLAKAELTDAELKAALVRNTSLVSLVGLLAESATPAAIADLKAACELHNIAIGEFIKEAPAPEAVAAPAAPEVPAVVAAPEVASDPKVSATQQIARMVDAETPVVLSPKSSPAKETTAPKKGKVKGKKK